MFTIVCLNDCDFPLIYTPMNLRNVPSSLAITLIPSLSRYIKVVSASLTSAQDNFCNTNVDGSHDI